MTGRNDIAAVAAAAAGTDGAETLPPGKDIPEATFASVVADAAGADIVAIVAFVAGVRDVDVVVVVAYVGGVRYVGMVNGILPTFAT
jgi:hypothetical protein